MNELYLVIVILSLVVPTMTITNVYATGAELDFDEDEYANSAEYKASCGNAGYDDGQNGGFDNSKHDECGKFYYDAFVEGCMQVEGNTKDVCESASDA